MAVTAKANEATYELYDALMVKVHHVSGLLNKVLGLFLVDVVEHLDGDATNSAFVVHVERFVHAPELAFADHLDLKILFVCERKKN